MVISAGLEVEDGTGWGILGYLDEADWERDEKEDNEVLHPYQQSIHTIYVICPCHFIRVLKVFENAPTTGSNENGSCGPETVPLDATLQHILNMGLKVANAYGFK